MDQPLPHADAKKADPQRPGLHEGGFNLSDWALKHRSLVWFLMIICIAAGATPGTTFPCVCINARSPTTKTSVVTKKTAVFLSWECWKRPWVRAPFIGASSQYDMPL